MSKKIITIFFSVFFSFIVTRAYASVEDTHVTFTNNTDQPISVHTDMMTDDPDFKKGSNWDEDGGVLQPYESKQVLWFGRHLGLKSNMKYEYDFVVSPHANDKTDSLVLRFDVVGSYYYGSIMANALQLPQSNMKEILKDKGLEHYQGDFWNGSYVAHVRRWKPSTNFFTNVHIVIDKKDTSSAPLQSKNTLKILTYNTQLQPFFAGTVNDLNQPEVRLHDIVPVIHNYDVVIFEELFDHELRDELAEMMSVAYPYHTRVVGENSDKAWTGGVMIFSKWPIEKEDQIIYQATTGSDAYAAKGAAYARINKGGKYYNVFGTHLEANHATDNVRVRRKQLAELENFVDRLNISANEPVLIGGDMNIDEFSLEVSTLYEFLSSVKLDNIGYQYSSDSFVNTMNIGSERERLDYVLYDTRYLVPKTAYNKVFVLRALYDEKMWPKFDLSDHFPVESYFRF